MSMHPLGQLITDRMSHPDNKWSLQRVVDQMESAGYRGIIGKSRLAQIRRDPVESIKGEVIFALAAGLGVTPLTVANAALASMGIEPRPSEVTDSVATVRIDPTLSDSSRELLIAMIRQMRAASPSDPSTHTPKEHRDGGQSGGSLVQLNPSDSKLDTANEPAGDQGKVLDPRPEAWTPNPEPNLDNLDQVASETDDFPKLDDDSAPS